MHHPRGRRTSEGSSTPFPALFHQSTQIPAERFRLVEAPAMRESALSFAHAVARGLTDRPRWLDCSFLYDARGSALFEEICAQPEYYPTRTESRILADIIPDVCELTGPVTLVELGSGSSAKTAHILRAYADAYGDVQYVPVDVSRFALEEAGEAIIDAHDEVRVTAIHGTYENAFPLFRRLSPAMVVFLGSTIGNFPEDAAQRFWRDVAAALAPGDYVLLGLDLVKDRALLEAAYDDAAGVTAKFTTNLFHRMNRELGAELNVDEIEHVARWNANEDRIEIYARFLTDQAIDVAPIDRAFTIRAGEEILVEISRKFRLANIVPKLASFGLRTRRVFTDDRDWFAVLLLQRRNAA